MATAPAQHNFPALLRRLLPIHPVNHEIGESNTPRTAILIGEFQPLCQHPVNEKNSAFLVSRKEPDRQVVEKIGQHDFLMALDRLQFAASRNVLGAPQHVTATIRNGEGRNLAPFDHILANADRHLDMVRDPGVGVCPNTGKPLDRFLILKDSGDSVQIDSKREQAMEGGIGVYEGAVGTGNQVSLGTRFRRLQQEAGKWIAPRRAAQHPGATDKRYYGQPTADHGQGTKRRATAEQFWNRPQQARRHGAQDA